MSTRVTLVGVALAAASVSSTVATADVIHLVNGSVIEVDAWRDAGDAIEFARGGGIIRISKAEIQRIDGKPSGRDLKMYSAPASPTSPAGRGATLDRSAAVKEMLDLLKQGEGLFAQTVLSPADKAGAFRRLGEKWQALAVPDVLREAHTRGQGALQVAAEAFAAEGEGTVPDAKERIESAKTGIQEAQSQVRRAGGEQG